MERKTEYQFRVLPFDPSSYITLDSEPLRRCEADIVYKIPENTFPGITCKLRLRKNAKEFAEEGEYHGKNFAVILKEDDSYRLLYIGRLDVLLYKRKVLNLCRCVGSITSKHHFKRIYRYILSHYKGFMNLKENDVITLSL